LIDLRRHTSIVAFERGRNAGRFDTTAKAALHDFPLVHRGFPAGHLYDAPARVQEIVEWKAVLLAIRRTSIGLVDACTRPGQARLPRHA